MEAGEEGDNRRREGERGGVRILQHFLPPNWKCLHRLSRNNGPLFGVVTERHWRVGEDFRQTTFYRATKEKEC